MWHPYCHNDFNLCISSNMFHTPQNTRLAKSDTRVNYTSVAPLINVRISIVTCSL